MQTKVVRFNDLTDKTTYIELDVEVIIIHRLAECVAESCNVAESAKNRVIDCNNML